MASFNRQIAIERVGGDEDLLKEIAGLFLGEYPGLMAEIELAVASNDPDRLQRAAHTLKGSLGTLGADESFPLALELELKGRRRQMEGADQFLGDLRGSLVKLHAELTSL